MVVAIIDNAVNYLVYRLEDDALTSEWCTRLPEVDWNLYTPVVDDPDDGRNHKTHYFLSAFLERLRQLTGSKLKTYYYINSALCEAERSKSFSAFETKARKRGQWKKQVRERERTRKENYASLPDDLKAILIGLARKDAFEKGSESFQVSVLCRSEMYNQKKTYETLLQYTKEFGQWLAREIMSTPSIMRHIGTLNAYKFNSYSVRRTPVIECRFVVKEFEGGTQL